jgi:hypothetical protein
MRDLVAYQYATRLADFDLRYGSLDRSPTSLLNPLGLTFFRSCRAARRLFLQ